MDDARPLQRERGRVHEDKKPLWYFKCSGQTNRSFHVQAILALAQCLAAAARAIINTTAGSLVKERWIACGIFTRAHETRPAGSNAGGYAAITTSMSGAGSSTAVATSQNINATFACILVAPHPGKVERSVKRSIRDHITKAAETAALLPQNSSWLTPSVIAELVYTATTSLQPISIVEASKTAASGDFVSQDFFYAQHYQGPKANTFLNLMADQQSTSTSQEKEEEASDYVDRMTTRVNASVDMLGPTARRGARGALSQPMSAGNACQLLLGHDSAMHDEPSAPPSGGPTPTPPQQHHPVLQQLSEIMCLGMGGPQGVGEVNQPLTAEAAADQARNLIKYVAGMAGDTPCSNPPK